MSFSTMTAQDTNTKSEIQIGKLTPMLQQYFEIKQQHPDCLLFYRLGDFYELFFEDAIKASKVLEITLTKRGKKEGDDIPMCGVPFHSSDSYISRLIREGFKVAVCEQVEEASEAKKRGPKSVVKRDVVRVITPGTLTEDTLLEARQNNFLSTIAENKGIYGIASIDISTGDFIIESCSLAQLDGALAKLDPKEILIPQKLTEVSEVYEFLKEWKDCLTIQPDSRFNLKNSEKRLLEAFNVSTLEGFGNFGAVEISAAGALSEYIFLTQKGKYPNLHPPKRQTENNFLQIDASTRRNLELSCTLSGQRKGSLLNTIDHTITAAGGRLLAYRLAMPITNIQIIDQRLDAIEWAMNSKLSDSICKEMKNLPDIERVLSRLSFGRGGPRDLANIRDGLLISANVYRLFKGKKIPAILEKKISVLDKYELFAKRLETMLSEDMPLLARDGGFVAPGYLSELDELRQLKNEGKQTIAAMQMAMARDTGIPSLKIKHNNVLGYYIEVTNTHKNKVPEHFIHRQTLASNLRYTTVELSELEQKIATAGEKAVSIELKVFDDIVKEILQYQTDFSGIASILAEIDLTFALAHLAENQGFCRPKIDTSLKMDIVEGRHPVVEKTLKSNDSQTFTPNDCDLDENNRVWLLTGPNMAGKSTFLRQNALIVIMAQMGSFVPAKKVHIGIVDRVFSRVGASDDLARGRSTFMVEMVETSAILNQSTQRSFVILDEIGRGTSTYDGVSLAWATVEHLHNLSRCRTLFATHYHELSSLEKTLPAVVCYSMSIKEWENKIIFLHKVIKGAADRSYGIHVAELAGIPSPVIKRAWQILEKLEKSGQKVKLHDLSEDLPLLKMARSEKLMPESSKLEKEIKDMNPDTLNPREALDYLYKLKGLISE